MRISFFTVCVLSFLALFLHEASCVNYTYVGCFQGTDITGGQVQRVISNPDPSNLIQCAYFCHSYNKPTFFVHLDNDFSLVCGCHNATVPAGAVDDSMCASTGCGSDKCGGGSTLQVNDQSSGSNHVSLFSISNTIVKPYPPALPTGTSNYVGCYDEADSGIKIDSSVYNFKYSSSDNVVDMCQQNCLTKPYYALFAQIQSRFTSCFCVSSAPTKAKADPLSCNKMCAGVPCGGSFFDGPSPQSAQQFDLSTTSAENAFVSMYSNTQLASTKPTVTNTQIFNDKPLNGWTTAMSSQALDITTEMHQSGYKSISMNHTVGLTTVFYKAKALDARYTNTFLTFFLSGKFKGVTIQLFTYNGTGMTFSAQQPMLTDIVVNQYPWKQVNLYLNQWFTFGVYDGFIFRAVADYPVVTTPAYIDTLSYTG